jgi:hypothetical protein
MINVDHSCSGGLVSRGGRGILLDGVAEQVGAIIATSQ